MLVTQSSFAQKNPQALADLLDGYFKALEVLKKDSESAILEIAGYQGISAAEFKQSLTGIHIPDREENKKLLSGKKSPIKLTANILHEFMTRKNIITVSNKALPEISNRFLLEEKTK